MLALQNIPRYKRREVAREWGRRSQAVQAGRRMQREPDLHTLRLRALHDRRGELIHAWRIVRSIRGRINQVDLIIDGQRWRTGSLERAGIAVAKGKWLLSKRGVACA